MGIDEQAAEWVSSLAMRKQFDTLTATELYCPRCRGPQPVRERLLLVLPRAELHEYRCVACGESLGTREVRQTAELLL